MLKNGEIKFPKFPQCANRKIHEFSHCEFLISCLFTISDVIEVRKEGPLLNLLNSLGGWPVLMGPEWIEEVIF